jgi:dTDP-4-dehydrorhamnose 3,5-epimerase
VSPDPFTVDPGPPEGVRVIRARAFADDRGWFYESWRADAFEALGIPGPFVQDNHSRSRRGVLRGLHWQAPPHAQGKLVRCTRGRVFDAVVDLRPSSPGYGRHRAITLSADDPAPALLWIPPGFAHGFLALEEDSEVQYRCTAPWARGSERCLRWDDPDLAIPWPVPAGGVRLSAKDREGTTWREYAAAPTVRWEGRP